MTQDVRGAHGCVPNFVAHLAAKPLRELIAEPVELQAHLGIHTHAQIVVHHPFLHLLPQHAHATDESPHSLAPSFHCAWHAARHLASALYATCFTVQFPRKEASVYGHFMTPAVTAAKGIKDH